jgi:hypothetical protein
MVANAALSAHRFGNAIDNFAKRDVLDLTGLQTGATAQPVAAAVAWAPAVPSLCVAAWVGTSPPASPW